MVVVDEDDDIVSDADGSSSASDAAAPTRTDARHGAVAMQADQSIDDWPSLAEGMADGDASVSVVDSSNDNDAAAASSGRVGSSGTQRAVVLHVPDSDGDESMVRV